MSAITDFSQCHSGILGKLDELNRLSALLEPAKQARAIAEQTAGFFHAAIFEHHLDEERELFPAVLRYARDGEERERVQGLIHRLVEEHRSLETMWKALEPQLRKVAQGQDGGLTPQAIQALVTQYTAHARFEEKEFLPLSESILGRDANHLAALGLSLHIRHTSVDAIPPHV